LLNSRDKKIIAFLDEFKAAHTGQLERLFFATDLHGNPSRASQRNCTQVLGKLVGHEVIKVTKKRDAFMGKLVYFTGKEVPFRHSLVRTELYVRMKTAGPGELYEFTPEYEVGDIRADAFASYVLNGRGLLFLIEIQVANAAADTAKYERLYESPRAWPWSNFPRVVIVSDHGVRARQNLFIRIGTDLAGWERIFD
jgi:hypothetical protein